MGKEARKYVNDIYVDNAKGRNGQGGGKEEGRRVVVFGR